MAMEWEDARAWLHRSDVVPELLCAHERTDPRELSDELLLRWVLRREGVWLEFDGGDVNDGFHITSGTGIPNFGSCSADCPET